MTEKMTVYSTNCPKCHILIKKLQMAGKDFDLVENLEDVFQASKRYDIKEAPFVVLEDKVYNFTEALKLI